ncbi:serine protease [Methylosinus sp. Sm6]|uniref:trypsin-like serine peptidase n=1 Tax=Methylosinus sp. Sm6 TaxID=2866948 RepID=UPI001C99768C|nr:trypsin-like serine protease [Methylosinus sp. Sm6]MBY6244036.1 trypsin-like serine protease [Methylosinus sp. Sm6]
MTDRRPRFAFSLAIAMAALTTSTAFAQQSTAKDPPGTVESPKSSAPAARGNPTPPTGPYRSVLPLADPKVFEDAEKAAPHSVPTGEPGGVKAESLQPQTDAAPSAYGTSTAPYTTARVAVQVQGSSMTVANTPVTSYPFRATGKLYFKVGAATHVCTASLLKPGVLITAAHCVVNYGKGSSGWYSGWVWCPANVSAAGGVYGCYNAGSARTFTTYVNGTDVCAQAGVVCNDDIATLIVAPRNGVLAGRVVGWYGYGWNGPSYRQSPLLGNVTAVQITQLGYPVALDSGYQMERTDAAGWYYASGNLKNTQIGSAQTGGSSGGPWLINFGTPPSFGAGSSPGYFATQWVVGVTSYGSASVGFNRQGASYFGQNSQFGGNYGAYGAGNIGLLMRDTCTANPTYC